MFDGLVTHHTPSLGRAIKADGGAERYLTEVAVMVAFAMHLLRTAPSVRTVRIHPDGEHGKRFAFKGWLEAQGFDLTHQDGAPTYSGLYRHRDGRQLLILVKPGMGDVAAEGDGISYMAECKGGVLNSTHAGQTSRLRRGLCETIGQLLATTRKDGERQFAVVPRTKTTISLAERLKPRAALAGIAIALVDEVGRVLDV